MKTIKVWDPFVRLFHWALVLAIATQLLTAESAEQIHVYSGYFIALLLLMRIVWGLIGSKHARFADFIYPVNDIFGYLKGLINRNPKHYLGHNPAGGAMVIALLFVLCLTAFAGLKTLGAEGKGPLAVMDNGLVADAYADRDERGEHEYENHRAVAGDANAQKEFWKEIHEVLVGIVIFLVILHICGVLASSYIHKENLTLAMFTGKKKTD